MGRDVLRIWLARAGAWIAVALLGRRSICLSTFFS
jgi:hypothetical protein